MARKFLTPIDLNKLELRNAAFQNLGIPPNSPSTGQFYYDTSASPYVLKVWDGAAWVTVGNTEEEIEDIVGGLIAPGSGISVDYNDGTNTLTIANTGVTSLIGTTNEVDVSASAGAVTVSLPSTINANTTGNASTATALQNARVISISGDASASASFDGTSNIDLVLTIDSNSAVSSLTGTPNEVEVSASVGAITISLPSTINADTTGNAATATALQTGRVISLGGDLSGSASFNGTTDITINANIGANSVALGTDTTGDYVQSASAGTGISVSGSGEGATVTITNTGVTSITGTANEVDVSASAGAVTVGLPNDVTIAGSLTVSGALTVSGSATYVNTEIIQLADNTIILNSNATGSASQDAGIEVERGDDPNVSVLWDETLDLWTLTNNGTNYHAITRKYATDIGNSASTQFTVTHNLGSRDVEVQVYDNSTYETVETDVVRNGTNTVQISFATAPGTNAYRVVVIG